MVKPALLVTQYQSYLRLAAQQASRSRRINSTHWMIEMCKEKRGKEKGRESERERGRERGYLSNIAVASLAEA